MRRALTHPTPTPERMPASQSPTGAREPRRYEIRVRGSIGPTIMQAFPTLTATRNGHDTLLTGPLPDQSALYGAIHQLEALGLQLLEIHLTEGGDAGNGGQIARSMRGRLTWQHTSRRHSGA